MSFLKKALQGLATPAKSTQEARDLSVLYRLFCRHIWETSPKYAEERTVADMPEPVEQPLAAQHNFIQENVRLQVQKYLGAFHQALGKVGRDRIITKELLDLDFCPYVMKSSIDHPEAGNGAFMEGCAGPGTVVGFYPGMVYLPRQIEAIPGFPNFSKNNSYVIARHDQNIINGKDCDTYVHLDEWRRQKEGLVGGLFGMLGLGGGRKRGTPMFSREDMEQLSENLGRTAPGLEEFDRVQNPFALGNMINHPPRGHTPNVMPCGFNVLRSFPRELLPYVPNKLSPRLGVVSSMYPYQVPALVLVATRPIEDGDELFLNYRYNPDAASIPDWFHFIDADENARRWEQSNREARAAGHSPEDLFARNENKKQR